MKRIIYLVLALLVVGGWLWYSSSGSTTKALEAKVRLIEDTGIDDEDELPKLKSQLESNKNEKIFSGIVLAFLSAGLVGVVVVAEVLPALAHRLTHSVYDSAEEVESDPMNEARSKVAQGDYQGAIDAFRAAAAADPMNRLPWVEIAKIQRENLEQPLEAIHTLRDALEGQEWEVNDAAYFLFRLAELYDEDAKDRTSAVSILNQVMEQFPNTRHSANARHRLHEWGLI